MALLDALKPRHQHSDPEVRRRAVSEIDDEVICVQLACEDPDAGVRRLALDKLQTVELLRRVAVKGKFLDTRLAAVARIEDPWVLAAILEERKNPDLMTACFEGIKDQEVLAYVARTPTFNVSARRIAISMFEDQELLLEVLRVINAPGLRRAAIERVEDEGLRHKLEEELEPEREDPHERIDRILATYDPETVVEVFGTLRDSVGAVKGLGVILERGGPAARRAEQILVRLLKHPRAEIRLEALSGLKPAATACRDAIQQVEKEDGDPRVREAARRLVAGPPTEA